MTDTIEYRRPCTLFSMHADSLTTKKRLAMTLREWARKADEGSVLDLCELGHVLHGLGDTALELADVWGRSYPREMRQ